MIDSPAIVLCVHRAHLPATSSSWGAVPRRSVALFSSVTQYSRLYSHGLQRRRGVVVSGTGAPMPSLDVPVVFSRVIGTHGRGSGSSVTDCSGTGEGEEGSLAAVFVCPSNASSSAAVAPVPLPIRVCGQRDWGGQQWDVGPTSGRLCVSIERVIISSSSTSASAHKGVWAVAWNWQQWDVGPMRTVSWMSIMSVITSSSSCGAGTVSRCYSRVVLVYCFQ